MATKRPKPPRRFPCGEYIICINERHESGEQHPFRWHITPKEKQYVFDGDLGNGKAPTLEIALKHAQEKVRLLKKGN